MQPIFGRPLLYRSLIGAADFRMLAARGLFSTAALLVLPIFGRPLPYRSLICITDFACYRNLMFFQHYITYLLQILYDALE